MMKKVASLASSVILILLSACTTTQSEPSVEVIPSGDGSEVRSVELPQKVEVDNCGGSGPQKQTFRDTLSLGQTLTLEQNLKVDTGGSVNILGIGEVKVGAEIAMKHGVQFTEIRSRERSREVEVAPGHKELFTVTRYEQVEMGTLIVRAGDVEREISYEIVTDFWLEATPEKQSCPQQPVGSVSISPDGGTIEVDGNLQLIATVRDTKGTQMSGLAVSWDSSNPTVATISTSGIVTGRSAGTCTITAEVEGRSDTVVVTVTQAVSSVTILQGDKTLEVGTDMVFEVTIRDSAGNEITDRSVNWTSSNPSVAVVSLGGVVTAKSAGTAVIKASTNGQSATVVVTVQQAVSSVTILQGDKTLEVGTDMVFEVTIRDSAGNEITDRSVNWTSSNPSVAVVSQEGEVTAKSVGTAVITASASGESDTVVVTVRQAVSEITIHQRDTILEVGTTKQFTVTVLDVGGNEITGLSIEWSSSNPSIVEVSPYGKVTAKVIGTAEITASANGESATVQVYVTPEFVPIYQYSATDPHRFLYSQNRNIGSGWTYDGVAFHAFQKETSDSVPIIPIYQYHAYDPHRFFYLTDYIPSGFSGWYYEGPVFYAFEDKIADSVPIHRYHATDPHRFLYSQNPNIGSGWVYDEIAFFALP